jgi:hypothetical protein
MVVLIEDHQHPFEVDEKILDHQSDLKTHPEENHSSEDRSYSSEDNTVVDNLVHNLVDSYKVVYDSVRNIHLDCNMDDCNPYNRLNMDYSDTYHQHP